MGAPTSSLVSTQLRSFLEGHKILRDLFTFSQDLLSPILGARQMSFENILIINDKGIGSPPQVNYLKKNGFENEKSTKPLSELLMEYRHQT